MRHVEQHTSNEYASDVYERLEEGASKTIADDVEHSFEEQPSDDEEESESSHEEGSDKDFEDGNIAAMFVNEANEEDDASETRASEDEDAGRIHATVSFPFKFLIQVFKNYIKYSDDFCKFESSTNCRRRIPSHWPQKDTY